MFRKFATKVAAQVVPKAASAAVIATPTVVAIASTCFALKRDKLTEQDQEIINALTRFGAGA